MHTNAGALRGQKRAPNPLELELEVFVSLWRGCWEPNSDPLQGWQMLLTAALSPASNFIFICHQQLETVI